MIGFDQFFELVEAIGLSATMAVMCGLFVQKAVDHLLRGIVGRIQKLIGMIKVLEMRAIQCNSDMVYMDELVSKAFEVKPLPGKGDRH
jgi:hypothetical protein